MTVNRKSDLQCFACGLSPSGAHLCYWYISWLDLDWIYPSWRCSRHIFLSLSHSFPVIKVPHWLSTILKNWWRIPASLHLSFLCGSFTDTLHHGPSTCTVGSLLFPLPPQEFSPSDYRSNSVSSRTPTPPGRYSPNSPTDREVPMSPRRR